MSKSYERFLVESIEAEARLLVAEAMLDQDKMDILEMFFDEEVANTASAPGLAMVSDGEPVSPKYKQREFGRGIWRRKPKQKSDLMEMALKRSKKATTGHLEHVADYLYHGVIGRHHDGTHFVRSKHGNEDATFTSEEDIHKTGKEHYVRDLIPALRHVKKMNIEPGHAFQADLVHHTDTKSETAKPNTITYKTKPGATLTIAAHSQYKLPKTGTKA